MKILIVGSGGREHALGWKLAQSPLVTQIVAAPGNPGLAEIGRCVNVAATDAAETLARLRAAGEPAAIIGTLKPGLPMIDVSGTV